MKERSRSSVGGKRPTTVKSNMRRIKATPTKNILGKIIKTPVNTDSSSKNEPKRILTRDAGKSSRKQRLKKKRNNKAGVTKRRKCSKEILATSMPL